MWVCVACTNRQLVNEDLYRRNDKDIVAENGQTASVSFWELVHIYYIQ